MQEGAPRRISRIQANKVIRSAAILMHIMDAQICRTLNYTKDCYCFDRRVAMHDAILIATMKHAQNPNTSIFCNRTLQADLPT